MSLIVKRDSNGVKPLLEVGEFGYDNYPAGGDSGRVYVGTGSENVPLAKKEEMSAVDGKADVHIARVDNPHGVTKAQVGLGNADNTADIDKIVASAGRLTAGKKINNVVFDNTQDITIKAETPNKVIVKFDGGATEGADIYTFDGSENKSVDIIAGLNVQLVKTPGSVTINVDDIETKWDEIQNVPSPTITLSGDVSGSTVMTELGSATLEVTIQPNSVELGVDTIGNYVGDVTGVEGITVTGAKGENWIPEISITPVGIAGTYTKVTTNNKGQVINGDILSHTDIPDIDASKITSGVIDAARLPSYVDDVLEFSGLDDFPLVGEAGKIYVALDTNKTYRWSGTSYIYITSGGAVDSVAGKTGVVILNKNDVGLDQVDNTSDVNKPISTATANALALKADIESPAFTGEPKAPTAAVGTNSIQLATTAFVGAEIADKAYSKTQLDAGQLDNRYYTETEIDTLDSTTVKLTGNQTIAGVKTFTSSIVGGITGNSATATKLQTARLINGVAFDGTGDITAPTNLGITAGTTAGPIVTSSSGTNATLPTASATASGVVTTGTQTIAGVKTFSSNIVCNVTGNITGNAGTATKLETARTINGVAFDGTANITISEIERGSNANGDYVKFADGTLICTAIVTCSGNINIQLGNLYTTPATIWYFPASFLGYTSYIISGSEKLGVGNCFLTRADGDNDTATSCSFKGVRGAAVDTIPVFGLMAVGRWK